MKLELKHLKRYLGTDLKCHASGMYTTDTEFDDKPKPQIFEIVGLNTTFVEIYEEDRTVTEYMYYCDIFPILRPLSDLTKEIEVNGEKFVPIEWLDKNIKPTKHQSPSVCFTDGYIEMSFIEEYEKLDEWQFDWRYDLIKNKLAIDINTL